MQIDWDVPIEMEDGAVLRADVFRPAGAAHAAASPANWCAATGYFKCDTSGLPTVMRVYEECMRIEAFNKAHPLKQPGAAPH